MAEYAVDGTGGSPPAELIRDDIGDSGQATPVERDYDYREKGLDIKHHRPAKHQSLWKYLTTDVDPLKSSTPLAMYCFMTGFVDSVIFSAIFVWPGFQTGNTVQLSLALARLFQGPRAQQDHTFHLGDRQALASLTTFWIGAFIGRLGDRLGPKTRLWLFLGTMIQTLFTMAAAIALWKSGAPSVTDSRLDPAWTTPLTYLVVAFLSASLGLQGIMGKRVNTQFATTVVLTTVWCELFAEPDLFKVHRRVMSRDHKIIAAFVLFLGGFIGRTIIDAIGSAGMLGVGTGIRFLIALSWLFIPGKEPKPPKA